MYYKLGTDMLGLAEEYLRGTHTMDVVMWRYLAIDAREKRYSMVMQRQPDGVYRPTAPVCLGNRTMMAVTAMARCCRACRWEASLQPMACTSTA